MLDLLEYWTSANLAAIAKEHDHKDGKTRWKLSRLEKLLTALKQIVHAMKALAKAKPQNEYEAKRIQAEKKKLRRAMLATLLEIGGLLERGDKERGEDGREKSGQDILLEDERLRRLRQAQLSR
jgi:hypothetical protein